MMSSILSSGLLATLLTAFLTGFLKGFFDLQSTKVTVQAAADKGRADQSAETKDVIQETADAQAANNARVRSAHDVAGWLRGQE